MNRKILQKVIDALNKEAPDLSYVKGILETVMESLPEEVNSMHVVPGQVLKINPLPAIASPVSDEGTALEVQAKAKMSHLDLSAIKTE